jgi:hypothetical protein
MKNILKHALPQCLAAVALAGILAAGAMAPQNSYAQSVGVAPATTAAVVQVKQATSDVSVIELQSGGQTKVDHLQEAKTFIDAKDPTAYWLISNTLVRNDDFSVPAILFEPDLAKKGVSMSGTKLAVMNGLAFALKKANVEFAISNAFVRKMMADPKTVSVVLHMNDTPNSIVEKMTGLVTGMDAGILKDNLNASRFEEERKVGDMMAGVSYQTARGLVIVGEKAMVKALGEDTHLRGVAQTKGVTAYDAESAIASMASSVERERTVNQAFQSTLRQEEPKSMFQKRTKYESR